MERSVDGAGSSCTVTAWPVASRARRLARSTSTSDARCNSANGPLNRDGADTAVGSA